MCFPGENVCKNTTESFSSTLRELFWSLRLLCRCYRTKLFNLTCAASTKCITPVREFFLWKQQNAVKWQMPLIHVYIGKLSARTGSYFDTTLSFPKLPFQKVSFCFNWSCSICSVFWHILVLSYWLDWETASNDSVRKWSNCELISAVVQSHLTNSLKRTNSKEWFIGFSKKLNRHASWNIHNKNVSQVSFSAHIVAGATAGICLSSTVY